MRSGLWRNSDFMKLWAGESVSLFGSQITALALPLVAETTLRATAPQMGLLNAAEFAPYLLGTLFAGVLVDRHRRRPVLMVANVGRALLLGLIPLSFALGALRIEQLYAATFFAGVLAMLFELAYTSYLPALVERADLVEGNSKLQVSASLAQVGGPGLAGMLVGWLGAPVAIVLDAVSYVVSVVSLTLVRKAEAPPDPGASQGKMMAEIRTGLRFVLHNPYIRAIAGEAATFNLFSQVTGAVLLLYMRRELHLSPALVGLVMSTASLGALLGSLLAGWVGRRFGTGPAIVRTMAIACAAPLLFQLAVGPLYFALPALVLGLFLGGVGTVISVVHVVTLRQAVIPQQLMGRVAAGYRFLTFGPAPVGALLGGLLGAVIGLRATLLVGALGTLGALGWVLLSPLPALRELPAAADGAQSVA